MEKRGYIQDGWTPPEEKEETEKKASAKNLTEHATKRAADEAENKLAKDKDKT